MEDLHPHHVAERPERGSTEDINSQTNGNSRKRNLQPRKRALGQIYALPFPVTCHPLPAFIPHNPLSIIRVVYALLSGYLKPYSSHPTICYKGIFSSATQSVHVTDPESIRSLWEKGFFGKGTLSRSDPSWLNREKRRQGVTVQQSSEEFTQNRREERRQMKFERALKEREMIENQLRQEGKILGLSDTVGEVPTVQLNGSVHDASTQDRSPEQRVQVLPLEGTTVLQTEGDMAEDVETSPSIREIAKETTIEDQEHLQISPEEALFLSFGLGVLEVHDEFSNTPLSVSTLFQRLRLASYSPNTEPWKLMPDDPFLLKYIAYHHFRSLGWVLRGGSKFSVDYLLYNRGPVFSHAEYAVLVLPSYSHPYWTGSPQNNDAKAKEMRDWHWLHCINRVQAHVHKTLVLAYVDIPPPLESGSPQTEEINIGRLLQRYKVREFVVRRWLLNRSRD